MNHDKKLYSARLDKENYELLETYVRLINKADLISGRDISCAQVLDYAIKCAIDCLGLAKNPDSL